MDKTKRVLIVDVVQETFVVVTTYGIPLRIEGAEQPLSEESAKSGIANMANDAMKNESAMASGAKKRHNDRLAYHANCVQ